MLCGPSSVHKYVQFGAPAATNLSYAREALSHLEGRRCSKQGKKFSVSAVLMWFPYQILKFLQRIRAASGRLSSDPKIHGCLPRSHAAAGRLERTSSETTLPDTSDVDDSPYSGRGPGHNEKHGHARRLRRHYGNDRSAAQLRELERRRREEWNALSNKERKQIIIQYHVQRAEARVQQARRGTNTLRPRQSASKTTQRTTDIVVSKRQWVLTPRCGSSYKFRLPTRQRSGLSTATGSLRHVLRSSVAVWPSNSGVWRRSANERRRRASMRRRYNSAFMRTNSRFNRSKANCWKRRDDSAPRQRLSNASKKVSESGWSRSDATLLRSALGFPESFGSGRSSAGPCSRHILLRSRKRTLHSTTLGGDGSEA